MKNNKTLFLVVSGLTILAAGCTREVIPHPMGYDYGIVYDAHPDHSKNSLQFRQYTSQSLAPGSALGIKKAGQDEWIGASGYSNLEHKTPFQTCTQFRTGSITKIFTAVVVMQLIESGKFTLATTLSSLLPELAGEIPDADKITVKQLLNHTSGLGQPTEDDVNYQLSLINYPEGIGSMDPRQKIRRFINKRPLKHQPGTNSYYSNAGYWMLGLIIEKATGKTVQANLEERIFGPLNLRNTYLEKRTNRNISRGYNFSGKWVKDVTLWDAAESDGDPAAGLVSNVPDLLRFGEALFRGQLVNDSSLAIMKETTSFPSCHGDCGYGLGIESWVAGNHSGYGKNGSSMGVDANLIYFQKEQTTIVLFSNYGGGNRKDVIEEILKQ